MWRRLHRDHVGAGQVHEYAGSNCLRTYGACSKLSEVSEHIDGWMDLFQQFGSELEHAHVTTRGMFIDILLEDMKSDITRKPKLQQAGFRELALWCKNRVENFQTKKLADLTKKEFSRTRPRPMDALQRSNGSDSSEDAPAWINKLILAVQGGAQVPQQGTR